MGDRAGCLAGLVGWAARGGFDSLARSLYVTLCKYSVSSAVRAVLGGFCGCGYVFPGLFFSFVIIYYYP